MISGYFTLNPYGQITTTRLKHSILKTFKLVIWVQLIFIAFQAAGSFVIPGHFTEIFLNWKNWVIMLFHGSSFCYAMWFITALLETYIMVYLLHKYNATKLLFVLLPICMLLQLLIGKYSFVYGNSLTNFDTNNFLMTGMPCFIVGMLIRRFEGVLPSIRSLIILLIISTGLMLLENHLLTNTWSVSSKGDVIIMTIPVAVIAFSLFLKVNFCKGNHPLVILGRDHTLNIYILHIIVGDILMRVLPKPISSVACGFIVIILTLSICVCAQWIKEQRRKATINVD